MNVKADTADNYYLDTVSVNPKNKKPIFFGAVQIKKSYVSFHFMPIYACPDLLKGLSEALKKRNAGEILL